MRPLRFFLGMAGISALVVPSHGFAAELSGRVRDTIAGGPATEATVRVKDTNNRQVTDNKGRFTFADLAPGRYTVVIKYKSYDPVSREIELTDEGSSLVVFSPSDPNLSRLTVKGRAGLGQYLTKRAKANFLDTVTAEEIRRSPDDDVSETLLRLPGINVNSSQGGSFKEETVNIRGLGGSFNNVTVNGQSLASTGGSRAVPLDVIPSDVAQEIEVSKTVTPDMDANSIGGTINIKTASAFDRDGPFGFVSGSLGDFSDEAKSFERADDDETPRKASVVGGTVFGPQNQFGITFNFSHQYDEFNTEVAEPDQFSEARNGVFLPTDTRLTQDDTTSERFSFGSRLDYRPSDDSEYYLDAFYTETDKTEAETMTQWKFLNRRSDADVAINNPQPGLPGDFLTPRDAGDVDKEADFSDLDSETTSLTFGTAHRFGRWRVEGDAHYSEAERQFDTDEWSVEIDDLQSVVDISGPVDWAFPVSEVIIRDESDEERNRCMSRTDLERFNDPCRYIFDEIDREGVDEEEETFAFGTDIRRDTGFFGNLTGFIQAGFNFRSREFERDESEKQFEPKIDVFLDQFGLVSQPDDVLGFPIGPAIDPVTAPRFDRNNPDLFEFIPGGSTEGSLEGDFTVEEDVLAGYFMIDADIGQWNIVTGVRVENTDTQSNVLELLDTEEELAFDEANREEITRIVKESNSYTDVFPSITARYRFNDRLTLRASATRTIARPQLQDLAGASVVDLAKDRLEEGGGPNGEDLFPDASIDRGNPDLDPRESTNLDLGAEYYFDNGGIVAATLFYKDIQDPIFAETAFEFNQIVQGNFVERVEINTRKNASEGSVYGAELQYNSQFTMLPAPWSSFGINANATFLNSEIKIPTRSDDPALGGQADITANVIPYYQEGPISVRVAYNYIDEFRSSTGGVRAGDEIREARFQLDLHGSFAFTDRLSGFVEVTNFTEEEIEDTHVGSGRLTRFESIPRSVWVGLRGEF